jgi:hypothetical protein
MAEGSDGRWGALDARLIYAHAKAAGYLYESHLRHRLSTDLGVDWTEVENGIADVRGVPENLIERFSKRSREIRGALDQVRERLNAERARLGLPPVEADSASAMNIAARETRAAKLAHVATAALLGSGEVIPVVGAARDQDVIRRADGTVAPVPLDERRWSTPEMLATEQRLVATAVSRQEAAAAVVPAPVLRASLRTTLQHLPTLGADQVEMAALLASSRRRPARARRPPWPRTSPPAARLASRSPAAPRAPGPATSSARVPGSMPASRWTSSSWSCAGSRSRPARWSSWTRRAWPAPASSPACSTTRRRRTPRWCWSATGSSSRRSTPAAATAAWSPAWVRFACWRTAARSSAGSAKPCATCAKAGCARR